MAGYGKLVQGLKKHSSSQANRDTSSIMAGYRNAREGIAAFSEGVQALGQVGASLYQGFAEGQSKWSNVEAGAKEYGMEGKVQDIKGKGSGWDAFFGKDKEGGKFSMKKQMESWFGPGEDTMKTMLTSAPSEEGTVTDISMQELGTMGKIISEGGRRFAKTYDPSTSEYRSIKESGWGEQKENEDIQAGLPETDDEGKSIHYSQEEGGEVKPITSSSTGLKAGDSLQNNLGDSDSSEVTQNFAPVVSEGKSGLPDYSVVPETREFKHLQQKHKNGGNGSSDDSMSFGEIFSSKLMELGPGQTFTWRDKEYSTDTKK